MAFFTVLALGLALQGAPSADQVRSRFLLTEKDAIYLADPTPVCGGTATKLYWSPGGDYLAVLRRVEPRDPILAMAGSGFNPQAAELQLVTYAVKSRKETVALRMPGSSQIQEVVWIPGSSKLLLLADVPSQTEPSATVGTAFWVSMSGESKVLAQAREREFLRTVVAADRPIAAVMHSRLGEVVQGDEKGFGISNQLITFFNAESKVLGTYKPPTPLDELLPQPGGRFATAERTVVNRKVVAKWSVLFPSGNGIQRLDSPAPKPANEEESELIVDTYLVATSQKDVPRIPTVRMYRRKDPGSGMVMVSTDATTGILASNGLAVAYIHRGIPMVRELARMPKELYLNMLAAAERSEAVMNAKISALGMLFYGADNDDNMLGAGSDFKNLLKPYIKDPNVLNNFVLVFAGGDLKSVENPASTILGYIPGPGGRAVAYLDGHVKWEADKP